MSTAVIEPDVDPNAAARELIAQSNAAALSMSEVRHPRERSLCAQLAMALDRIDSLTTSLHDQESEVTRHRDAEHRVRMLCSRGPVVFTKAVRDALAGRA